MPPLRPLYPHARGFRPFGVTAQPPAGFTGPVPGQTVLSTDSRWQLLTGSLAPEYYHPSYLSQPVRYFDSGQAGSREITLFIGPGGLEVYNGDSAPLYLLYELRDEAGVLAASFVMQVAAGAGGGANQKVYTLAPGAVPAGVYTLRGIHPAQPTYGVFDAIKLL